MDKLGITTDRTFMRTLRRKKIFLAAKMCSLILVPVIEHMKLDSS